MNLTEKRHNDSQCAVPGDMVAVHGTEEPVVLDSVTLVETGAPKRHLLKSMAFFEMSNLGRTMIALRGNTYMYTETIQMTFSHTCTLMQYLHT